MMTEQPQPTTEAAGGASDVERVVRHDAPGQVEREQRQARFRSDLQDLLNRHSMENGSNTPDYQLADYLIVCLNALDEAINKRASWYGRFDHPGA